MKGFLIWLGSTVILIAWLIAAVAIAHFGIGALPHIVLLALVVAAGAGCVLIMVWDLGWRRWFAYSTRQATSAPSSRSPDSKQ